ncbi:MAG: hypothetical protein H7338_00730 [Candidatus Sericytochromatia bacterium]|nr:hypothetical protein [Candidatus Sericytochromatia bacterium]
MRRLLIAGVASMISVLAACGGGAGLLGQTSVSIDVKFSRTARDSTFLPRNTEEITLAITGEGLSRPIETSLAPVAQVVAMQLPPGFKDFTAQAWKGNQLLAQGEASALMESGKQTAIILNLVPINDGPVGSTVQAPTGLGRPATVGGTAPTASAGPGTANPALGLALVPGTWPSPAGRG